MLSGSVQAGAGQGEGTIDRQAEAVFGRPQYRSVRRGEQPVAHSVEPLAGDDGHRHDLGALQASAGEGGLHLVDRLGDALSVDDVGLGQGDQTPPDPEQV